MQSVIKADKDERVWQTGSGILKSKKVHYPFCNNPYNKFANIKTMS